MDSNDDEAPKDPGSMRQYTEKDYEGELNSAWGNHSLDPLNLITKTRRLTLKLISINYIQPLLTTLPHSQDTEPTRYL